MKYIIAVLITFIFLCNINDAFSKGGGGGRGGHYSGGRGSSHKGGTYVNPSTGNHYSNFGSGGGSSSGGRGSSGRSTQNDDSDYVNSWIKKYRLEREIEENAKLVKSYKVENQRNNFKNGPLKYSKIKINNSLKRDVDGKIIRSETAKNDFLKSIGKKDIPLGYQIDHIIPLYAGGCDCPSNMQLISVEAHKGKTKNDYNKYGG